jgi:hypothetical protein
MGGNIRFEDWESEQLCDPEFWAAAMALEPEYQQMRRDSGAIFDIVLSDEEIALLAAGKHPTEVAPGHVVAYWPLREVSHG